MSRKRVRTSSLAALALSGLLGFQPGEAAATEHMIGVVGNWNNPNCGTPTANNSYYIEAWGFDALGRKVCEVFVNPAAPPRGYGQCNPLNPLFPATQHAPRITLRNTNTLQFVQELPTSPASPPIAQWTPKGQPWVLGPLISHTIPAHGSCAQTTISAASLGFDTP